MGNNQSSSNYKSADFTPEQLDKLRIEFDNYDENGNHLLELQELEAFLNDHMPDLVRFSRVIMSLFGTGKKGTITFDMFLVFYNSLQTIGVNESDPSSLPMLIFSKLDSDNNYYISYKEIEFLYNLIQPKKSKKKFTKKDAKKLIHEQNPAREDWGLSRDEFIKLFDSFLSQPPEENESSSTSISQIIAVGFNKQHQIGENPKPSQPVKLDIVGSNYRSISAGESHSVIITEDSIVYGMGSNKQFQLGGDKDEYSVPTPLMIYHKRLVWASCGESFTVYLTEDGEIVFCGSACRIINKAFPKPYVIEPESKNRFVYVSACSSRFCAIDSSGTIFIYSSDPRQRPLRNCLPIPAYDVACGYSNISGKFYAIAVTVSGQAFGFEGLNNDLHHFAPIQQLSGIQVKRVFGHSKHLAILTDNGQVWTYGNGNCGQCGNGSNEGNGSFKPIKCNQNLVFTDAALGENHSIFITKDGEAFSCGDNKHFQLCLGMTKKPTLEPTPSNLVLGKAMNAACGSYHTIILLDSQRILHPGMAAFGINQI
ncbi:hypothetical protein M9Y10_011258 [Tritrichomonas musculus]|uniref:EF-hand domain-containing protein n=1 Tax=Tritrichomonas musculus TaxID=1915356 RepID=A0ABR2IJ20_9EUKA